MAGAATDRSRVMGPCGHDRADAVTNHGDGGPADRPVAASTLCRGRPQDDGRRTRDRPGR